MPLLRRAVTPQDVATGVSNVLSAEAAKVYNAVLRSMMECVKAGQRANSFSAYVTCVDSLPPKIRDIARGMSLQIVNGMTGRQWDWATVRKLAQSGDLPLVLLQAIYGVAQTGAMPQPQQQKVEVVG